MARVEERLNDLMDDLPYIEAIQKSKALAVTSKEEADIEPKSVKYTMREWYLISNALQFLYCNAEIIRAALAKESKKPGLDTYFMGGKL